MSLKTISLFSLLFLEGCASITSAPISEGEAAPDGLIYYMPKRPIKITISADDKGKYSYDAEEAKMEPDLNAAYVLSQSSNMSIDNKFSATVGITGLLSSGNSTATNQSGVIAANIVTAAGSLNGLSSAKSLMNTRIARIELNTKKDIRSCPANGQNTIFLIDPSVSTATLCDSIEVELIPEFSTVNIKSSAHASSKSNSPGIFYRQELPYTVKVKRDNLIVRQFQVTSPSNSPIFFMPINRTAFASNDAKVTLSDGVLTSVDQTKNSELVGFFAIPADILSKYFSAIGSVFDAFKSSDKQSQLLQQQQVDAIAKLQNSICNSTIAKYDWKSMSEKDKTAAMADVKSACSN